MALKDKAARKAWNAAYYARNKEKAITQSREWRQANRERAREITNKCQRANPEIARRSVAKRRAIKHSALRDGIEVTYKGKACFYCGDPAQAIDHFFPLSIYKDDRAHNKVPACTSCNSRKSNKHPFAFLLELKAEKENL